jgi:hypothetical protein
MKGGFRKMYKAKIDICEFKKGDIVPDERAIIWEEMYSVSPVEKLLDKNEKVVTNKEKESNNGNNSQMFDDYLNRGKSVVLKNLYKDKFSLEELNSLLEMEKNDKNRKPVISLIKEKILEAE